MRTGCLLVACPCPLAAEAHILIVAPCALVVEVHLFNAAERLFIVGTPVLAALHISLSLLMTSYPYIV